MCAHHLGGRAEGLECSRLDPHDQDAAGGHVYQSTSGIPDCPKEEL